MRHLIVILLFCASLLAEVWSSSGLDDIAREFINFDSLISDENQAIIDKYDNVIKPLLEEIKKEEEKKKKLLAEIRALKQDTLLNIKQEKFLLEQEKNLGDVENDVNSIR